jgi:Na+/proline symporter
MEAAMRLAFVDWLAVAAYFLFNILIGLYYRRRATASTEDYFVGGRKVTWWLAGTSMVATTFAADTPLAVTGLVASYGIAGNWLWWNMLMSGMLTVFFYARLWRRAGVLTDVEFAEIRYSGKPAAFLRGFRALYLGLPINCIIMGWVNLAMVKILMLIFGITKMQALLVVFGIMLLTAMISTLSGLWGVLVTDLFQFALKMGMMIVLAILRCAVGGMGELNTSCWIWMPQRRPVEAALFSHYARHRIRMDADAYLSGLPRNQLVGDMVSWGGAGRGRVYRAANPVRQR